MIWRWKNFKPQELRCSHCGDLVIHEDSMDKLQALRDRVGPIILTSAYRCPHYNALVGGAPMSQHKFGRAFDVRLGKFNKAMLHEQARAVGFTGFGLNYNTFIHIDTGPERTW